MNEIEKQIEEMAKKSGVCLYPTNHCGANGNRSYCWCDARRLCENLIEHYQPKLSENAVVLDKEEYEKLKSIEITLEEFAKADVVVLSKEEYEKLNNKIEVLRETITWYDNDIKKIRKETAREILAKLQGYYHQPSDTVILDINDFYEIAKEYGVGVE